MTKLRREIDISVSSTSSSTKSSIAAVLSHRLHDSAKTVQERMPRRSETGHYSSLGSLGFAATSAKQHFATPHLREPKPSRAGKNSSNSISSI